MAGESAREIAKRRREKGERLQRSAEMFERGAEGEEATARALGALPSETWTCFHDVKWPGRPLANVDHIVVGPPGVFVIDSKNWSGSITVGDDVLRQNGRSREKDVAAAAESALAVAGLVPLLRPDLVKPVLCFVREEQLAGWARDVMVCSTANVVEMLTSRPRVLSDDDLRHLTLDVDGGLRAAAAAAPPARRRVPAAPLAHRSTRPAPRRPAGRRNSSLRADGIKALIALVFAWMLLTQPAVVSGVAEVFTGWFTDGLSQEQDSPAEQRDRQPAKEKKQERGEQGQP